MEVKGHPTKEWLVNQEIKEELKQVMETNENENTLVQNLCDTAEAILSTMWQDTVGNCLRCYGSGSLDKKWTWTHLGVPLCAKGTWSKSSGDAHMAWLWKAIQGENNICIVLCDSLMTYLKKKHILGTLRLLQKSGA